VAILIACVVTYSFYHLRLRLNNNQKSDTPIITLRIAVHHHWGSDNESSISVGVDPRKWGPWSMGKWDVSIVEH
jgi:hypothetical protein